MSFIVRKFHPIMGFIDTQPMWKQNIVNLILLPLNYLFELGFFFLIGLEWWQNRRRLRWRMNPYKTAEVILLATTVILVTSSLGDHHRQRFWMARLDVWPICVVGVGGGYLPIRMEKGNHR